MKNFLQEGCIVTVTAPATTTSGDYVVAGGFRGVAMTDAASGADVAINRAGVFTLPKATGAAWAIGDALYWDSGNKKFTKVATGNAPAGVAAAAALSADATGSVAIVPGSSGHRFVAGQITTASATDTVVTGLGTVLSCGAGLDDNPGDNPEWANATLGDQAGSPAAGSIVVKTWQNTSGSDPTPAAATTFSKKVNWWAFGY